MVKCEVIENFSLKDFNKLKNIKRKSADVNGSLYEGDTFECDEKMAKYLTGDNALEKVVVKVIEVEPETYEAKVEKAQSEDIDKNDKIEYNMPQKKGRKKKEV